jgi:hypothetical protein
MLQRQKMTAAFARVEKSPHPGRLAPSDPESELRSSRPLQGRVKNRVSKFWREYAGKLAIEAIDDKVMREFIPWRRDYYADFKKLPKNAKRHPADRTIQFDMMIGKAIIRWAAEQGLRGRSG